MFVMKIEYVLEVLRTHFLKKASAKGFETDAFIHHDDIIQVSLIQVRAITSLLHQSEDWSSSRSSNF